MTRVLRVGWLVVALVLGACGPGESRSPAAVVDAFHAALRRGDAASALSLLAPDLLVVESGAMDLSRGAYESVHLPTDMKFSRAVKRKLLTRRTGGNGEVRWVISTYRLTGMWQGFPLDTVSGETMLLRREGSDWRIFHIHWSSQ